MRSRTEMVTTTLDGSDFDEETDFEDSEEDWRPEKGDPKALKRKTRDILTGAVGGKRGGRSNGSRRGRKSAAKGRGSGRRRKFDYDDNEEDNDDDDEDDEEDDRFDSEGSGCSTPPVPKRGRKSSTTPQRTYGRKSESKTPPSTSKGAMGQMKLSPTSSGLDSSGTEHAVKPIQRKVAHMSSSFPDKSGYLKLFASRADLEEGIRDNLKVCLWRRDGSSLLQKYFRDKSVDASTPQFTSSMVYSCWEDKRADEYMEVKVRCIEQSKQLRVQIIDVDATESRAKEEYQKYIEKYGKTPEDHDTDRSNGNRSGSASSGAKKSHDNEEDDGENEQEDEDYDAEEQEEEMQGAEGSDDPSQEE
uniref:Uncharacterized protein n=1 Tax=Anopheles culicifacies TaxID=139723 RepID=A0A182MPS1_9DIPT